MLICLDAEKYTFVEAFVGGVRITKGTMDKTDIVKTR